MSHDPVRLIDAGLPPAGLGPDEGAAIGRDLRIARIASPGAGYDVEAGLARFSASLGVAGAASALGEGLLGQSTAGAQMGAGSVTAVGVGATVAGASVTPGAILVGTGATTAGATTAAASTAAFATAKGFFALKIGLASLALVGAVTTGVVVTRDAGLNAGSAKGSEGPGDGVRQVPALRQAPTLPVPPPLGPPPSEPAPPVAPAPDAADEPAAGTSVDGASPHGDAARSSAGDTPAPQPCVTPTPSAPPWASRGAAPRAPARPATETVASLADGVAAKKLGTGPSSGDAPGASDASHGPTGSAPGEGAPAAAAPVDGAPAAAAPVVPPRPFKLEMEQLARIRQTNDPARALILAQEGHAQFPRGVFWQEREAAAITALTRLGRTGDARTRARAFLQRHPESPYAAELRRVSGD